MITRSLVFALLLAPVLSACGTQTTGPASPLREPAKDVDLQRYIGKWHEQGRYEQSFQRGCEGVTADYAVKPDGTVEVVNSCRQGSVDGPLSTAIGRARVVEGSRNAKLKVSFFGPFEGDYWVLDRAGDYSWALIGEGSGRFLWILTRQRKISEASYRDLVRRAVQKGYDASLIRRTKQ
jgi:apolipoprotein D and lipocalin family protein